MGIRKGIAGAAATREAKRRRDARESGLVLERKASSGASATWLRGFGAAGGGRGRDRGSKGRKDVAVDAPAGPIRCQRCGATWATREDEARLRVMRADVARDALRPRTDDGRPMLTAAELVDRGLVSSISNVRVIAHRRRIPSVRGHYDPDAFPQRVTA